MACQITLCLVFLSLLHFSTNHAHKISPHLDFDLKQLSGVQIGDNAQGLNGLKNYLTYLGYLNSDNLTHQNENIFDKSLEFALKKYQSFYNLSITGVLDANTITKMQEPRCGFPDFPSTNKYPFHVISQHYSFFPGHRKWDKRKLNYAFNINVEEYVKPPLERALKEWADATPFRFHLVKRFTAGQIRISFLSGDHGDELPFGSPGAGVAHSFGPNDGRVHFNEALPWASNGDANAFDVQSVGLHEFGHVLGLGHSNIEDAIMYPTLRRGEVKHHLHVDDINGMKALYEF